MAVLPDLLQEKLNLVFCGTAASRESAARRAYYAHPGNLFWKTLHQVGLTPLQLRPEQYPQLLQYQIGLTDLNKAQSGVDADLDRAAYDVTGLRQKVFHYRPRVLAFTSKHGASVFYGSRKLAFGRQPELVGETMVWILPSTSGSARPHWGRLQHHWHDLGEWYAKVILASG